MTPPMERIQILETIEKDIVVCLQSAGQACMELSKEKSSLKQAESQTHQFLKTLGQLESKLSEQINYLTQVSTGVYIYLTISLSYPFQYTFLINVSHRSTTRRFRICKSKGTANGMAQIGARAK
ncbi:PREDICTED: mediator of RNA polymerase II transcription subunit 11 isoform X1 [Acromyrmex echinatior]|uniref:mediator of RNA polymerase II transcription subunit 11 isoform X1 n=1 Tax=Acromyrmex echinatior TaxID=103372 RepID=UPI000580D816|nr:PREDICTED: mediator of RNA polymerase II transcription subunit 11 isoform X1 [Acromyrmex echinatior]